MVRLQTLPEFPSYLPAFALACGLLTSLYVASSTWQAKGTGDEGARSRAQGPAGFTIACSPPPAFQTEGKLYLILDFLRGGDLFTRLSKEVSL